MANRTEWAELQAGDRVALRYQSFEYLKWETVAISRVTATRAMIRMPEAEGERSFHRTGSRCGGEIGRPNGNTEIVLLTDEVVQAMEQHAYRGRIRSKLFHIESRLRADVVLPLEAEGFLESFMTSIGA